MCNFDGTVRIGVIVGRGAQECGGSRNWRQGKFERKGRKRIVVVELIFGCVALVGEGRLSVLGNEGVHD